VTHDTFAVAGHVIGTAWNVTKVRKAINPTSNGTLSTSALKALKLKRRAKLSLLHPNECTVNILLEFNRFSLHLVSASRK